MAPAVCMSLAAPQPVSCQDESPSFSDRAWTLVVMGCPMSYVLNVCIYIYLNHIVFGNHMILFDQVLSVSSLRVLLVGFGVLHVQL